jgi:hypothetical protein
LEAAVVDVAAAENAAAGLADGAEMPDAVAVPFTGALVLDAYFLGGEGGSSCRVISGSSR